MALMLFWKLKVCFLAWLGENKGQSQQMKGLCDEEQKLKK
jgi:hypothetical protein